MNAGASGSDMACVLRTVEFVTADGGVQVRHRARVFHARVQCRPTKSSCSVDPTSRREQASSSKRQQPVPQELHVQRGGNGAASQGWGYRVSPFQAMPRGAFAITGATVELSADPEAPARLVSER